MSIRRCITKDKDMNSHFGKFKVLLCFAIVIWMFLLEIQVGHTQDSLDLEIIVEDVTALPGEQGVTIPIYMKNYHDTLAAFNLWLVLHRPDIMEFQMDLDRNGTLMEDWEIWGVNTLGGQGHDLVILGVSNFSVPYTNAIPPQYGEIPLMKVIVDVYNIPDTMTDRTVNIHVVTENLDHFGFADPNGGSIGIATDSFPDTTWFICTQWSEPDPDSVCLNWEEVPGPPADSIDVNWILYGVLDTTKVVIIDGSLAVWDTTCGNIDGVAGPAGPVDVADLTYLVAYLFQSGPQPPVVEAANVDGIIGPGGPVDVADLTYLVAFLFQGGSEPVCWK